MTDRNDFLAAVEIEVTRWLFAELIAREFAPGEVPTASLPLRDAST